MATTASKAGKENATPRDLEEDIRQLREDMAQLMRHIGQTGEDSASAARRAASESVDHVRRQGDAAIRRLKRSSRDLEHELSETLQERPITSLALAVGVGYLLAMVSRR